MAPEPPPAVTVQGTEVNFDVEKPETQAVFVVAEPHMRLRVRNTLTRVMVAYKPDGTIERNPDGTIAVRIDQQTTLSVEEL